ncbi:YutD-like domain-containing protein [Paenibacillus gansuensis]|uniref:YutD-like domain-containing protein n=1 Tax=Paenibacillus gansuensis TaxID=306542 RepID=A0ABW5PER2_9BACL
MTGKTYQIIQEHKIAWNPEAFRDRYSEVLERYDYIVGDWGYNQLRLKGFFKEDNPKVTRESSVAVLQDYLHEYCNFGCAYFILEKVNDPVPEELNPATTIVVDFKHTGPRYAEPKPAPEAKVSKHQDGQQEGRKGGSQANEAREGGNENRSGEGRRKGDPRFHEKRRGEGRPDKRDRSQDGKAAGRSQGNRNHPSAGTAQGNSQLGGKGGNKGSQQGQGQNQGQNQGQGGKDRAQGNGPSNQAKANHKQTHQAGHPKSNPLREATSQDSGRKEGKPRENSGSRDQSQRDRGQGPAVNK